MYQLNVIDIMVFFSLQINRKRLLLFHYVYGRKTVCDSVLLEKKNDNPSLTILQQASPKWSV